MKWLGKWRVLNIQKVHGEVSINISRGRKGSDEKYRYVLLDFNKKHYLCSHQNKMLYGNCKRFQQVWIGYHDRVECPISRSNSDSVHR
jgi:hypothetical protein